MALTPARIKICGLTRPDDVDMVVGFGAHAIGLVMYPGSKRAVTEEQAVILRRRVPAFVSVVALFVNASTAQVRSVIDNVQPDLLQFHGDETPEYCESFGRRYMRAFRVGGPQTSTPQGVLQACRPYQSASAWLFDTYSAGYGGSGLSFDAALLERVQALPDAPALVLAGGLKPDTVAAAVRQVQPFAVDVSSGVESAPGVKDAARVRAFIRAVQGPAG